MVQYRGVELWDICIIELSISRLILICQELYRSTGSDDALDMLICGVISVTNRIDGVSAMLICGVS